ncbi:MAG: ribosomal protein S18-alanine N-acetyltransferase [Clostridia bacterium]|jgi:ribosomal-protein-alanine N-acetyltransferase|nr:ribosomal protein S18-alanine N-acetyltransferase [Clostridia bacterium]
MDKPPSINEIEIVPLEVSHIREIAQLEELCFSDPWTEDMFIQLLSNPLAVFITAQKDGEVVGYAGIYHILSEGQLMNIAVKEEYRRLGIAEKMFDFILEYAKENDIEVITLEVRKENDPAISLYEKLGFEKVGERPGYYSHPTDDAVLMNYSV